MRDGPRSIAARGMIVVCAILIPQVMLYWPSLFDGKIALPVDLLCGYSERHQSSKKHDPNFALWDPIWYYEPLRQFTAREIRAGRLPLWNPEIYCGVPIIRGTLSPFRWLYYLFPDPGTLVWVFLSKSLVAGLGTYLFFRAAMRVGYWPAVFGAAAYPLTGFFVLWHYYDVTSATAWIPWLLLFADLTIRRPTGFAPIGVAVTTSAVLFVGVVAPWPHVLLASGLYALWRLGEQYGVAMWRTPRAIGAMSALAAAWCLGGMLTAPQSLPAAEYLQTSHRVAARAKGVAEQPKTGWKTGIEILFPYHHGDTTATSLYLPRKGNRLEGAPTAYAGLLTILVLGPWAFCHAARRKLVWFWAGLWLFGLLWHLDPPVISNLFSAFPFNLLRNNRFTMYTGWAGVALAVSGLEVLLTTPRRWQSWFWGPMALIVTAGMHVVLGLIELPEELLAMRMPIQSAWFQRVYIGELCVCAAALVAWWALRKKRWGNVPVVSAICALALGEMIYTAWTANPQGDRACYYPRTPITESFRHSRRGRVAMGRYLVPNMNMMYGCSEIRGYDGADPQRVVRLCRAAQPRWEMNISYAVTQTFEPPRSPIMDMLALRYVFHLGEPPPGQKTFARDRLGWVEERNDALPRVYVPRRVELIADDADCLDRLRHPAFDPREIAFVSADRPQAPGRRVRGTASIVEEHPTRVVVAARMRTPGWLVLADAWAPGWKAFVDGVETPVRRANYLVRGVELPGKDCTIEFRYEPESFDLGLHIALSSLALLGGWCLVSARLRWGFPATT